MGIHLLSHIMIKALHKQHLLLIGVFMLFSLGLLAQVPTPFFPKNNVIAQNPITLRWNATTTALSYEIEYADNAALTGSTLVPVAVGTSHTLPILTTGKYYFWRVRAQTAGGPSAWSQTWRFGVFLPTDWPDLVFWISGDGPMTVDIAGRLTQWTDRSTQANHVNQSNPAKQPLLVASGFNGRPVVRFDGGDVLSGGDVLDLNANSRTSIVLGKSNTNTGAYFAKAIAGSQQNRFALTYSTPNLLVIHHDNSVRQITLPRSGGATELLMTVADRSALVLNLRINGFNAGTPVSGLQGSGFNFNSTYRFLVGAYNDASDVNELLMLNGDIAEMFFYDRTFVDSVRQLQEKYVMDKYYPPVNIGADTVFAYGFCGTTLTAGTGFTTYSWSGGGNTANKVITAPGTYSVTVTDVFGRASADTLVVTMPNPNFVGNPIICLDGSVTWNTGLPTTGYTFNWSPASGNVNSINITTPGTYRVTVTDINNCSYVSPAVTFTVDSFKSRVAILTGADTSLCSGNNIGLARGANLVSSYQWSTSDTTPTITVDTSGLYSLTVTNSNTCEAILTAQVNITGSGPITNFVVDTICLGAPTQFTDLSTISPPYNVGSWNWNFGDGSSSTSQNPSYTYSAAGTYNAVLITTSDSGCISSPITKQVLVRPTVVAQFYDTLACLNAPALFFDASIAPAGDQIVGWNWDFGNSTSDTAQNPQTVYASLGGFPVSLIVNTQFGCRDTVQRNLTVGNTAPQPGPFDFLSPQPGGLNIISPSILFQWEPSPNAVRYLLEVSTSSNFANPILYQQTTQTSIATTAIPFSQSMHYYRVTAFNVCSDAITSSVLVFYRFTPDLIPGSLQLWVMADGQLIKNSANNVSSWLDQSGNNRHLTQAGSGVQPIWVDSLALINYKPALRFDGNDFLSGGDILNLGDKAWRFFLVGRMNANDNSYFAKAVAANAFSRYGLIKVSNQLNFLVNDNIGAFEAKSPTPFGRYELVRTSILRPNGVLELHRNSTLLAQTGGLQIGANIVSTTRFLVGAYSNAFDNNQLLYLDGSISELIAIDTTLTQYQTDLVERYLYHKYSRPVWLGPDIKITYGFCDTIILDASERYEKYLWSTGDTTKTLRIRQSGTYWVEVTDVFNQMYRDTINITLPSVAPPTVSTICLGDSIVWDANLGPDYSYQWNVGDTTPILVITSPGTYFVTIADTNSPQCIYISDLHTVVLDSFAITTTLGADTTLCAGAQLGIQGSSSGIIAYNWSTAATTPTIQINNPGTYYVNVLNVSGCQATDTIEVAISGQLANVNFAVPPAFCLGDTSNFLNQTTIQSPFNILDYKWDFGVNNDTSLLQNPSYYYNAAGTYSVSLLVTSDSGCVNSLTKTIRVFNKPTARYTYQIGCAGAPLNFLDQSIGVANDALAGWLWEFGDDSTSTLRNPSHVYSQAGVYEVRLTVTSTTGCTSTFTDTLEVYPELIAAIGVQNLCFGETTQFTDASPGFSNIKWDWDLGNGNFTTQENPTINYTQIGTFLVRLTVNNALGCQSTVFDTISIVQPPTADFTYNVACEDFNFRLNDASTQAGNDPIVKWRWEFNDGGLPSNAPNPVRTYDTTGTFPVTLAIESANGCPASITKQVTIAPAPVASFTFTPDYGAAPLLVTYTNTSVGATSYQWFFGGGGYSQDENPQHTFQYNEVFTTTMIATGPGGCKDTAISELTVNIATLDIAVVEIDVENVNNRVRPYATIINQGTRDVDHYYLTSSLGDGSRITERVDTFLASGTGMIYYFRAGYEATEFQANSFLCIQASLPNEEVDDNGLNDRLCKPLENDIRIVPPYPNPTTDVMSFEVLIPREEVLEISVYDVLGHKLMDLHTGMAEKGTLTYQMDMSGYAKGVYLLRIKYVENEQVMRFVVD